MELSLPIGISHDGILLKTFSISRPTGALRGEIKDAPNHIPGMDLAAFKHVLRTLGPLDRPNEQILRRMTLPDVQYVHACCTAARYDGKIPVRVKCEACGHEYEDSVQADGIAILDADAEVKFVNDKAVLEGEVEFPTTGRRAKIQYFIPTIALEIKREDGKKRGLKDSEVHYQRVADTIVTIDGVPGPTAKQLCEMDLDDFDALVSSLDSVRVPRLDEEVVTVCPACEMENLTTALFEWWILPFDPRKQKKP
jgi:hypothetical protein